MKRDIRRSNHTKFFLIAAAVLFCAGLVTIGLLYRDMNRAESLPATESATPAITDDSYLQDTSNESTPESALPENLSAYRPVSTPASDSDYTPADSLNELSEPESEYPKVVKADENEAVINFTDPSKGKTDPPDAPTEPSSSDNAVKPTATPTATPAPKSTPKPTATPKPKASSKPPANNNSGTRSDGAVYDPVFGWVVPSTWISEPIDSEGDINKMVGSMGGP